MCGEPNRCAMEIEKETGAPQPPCWCMGVDFSEGLLARLDDEAKGRACICQACQASQSQPLLP